MESEVSHDDYRFCPVCGNQHFAQMEEEIAGVPSEYSTACTECEHIDYWVEGSYQSRIEQEYDSRKETYDHIVVVRDLIERGRKILYVRGKNHDRSKLAEPEKSGFDEFTPKLRDSTYGSAEYKQFLADMKPFLDHHYANNSHHPEHYENGMDDFDLFDLFEMFCDWLAVTKRHADGDILKSIEINQNRFGYSDMLKSMFKNTYERYYKDE